MTCGEKMNYYEQREIDRKDILSIRCQIRDFEPYILERKDEFILYELFDSFLMFATISNKRYRMGASPLCLQIAADFLFLNYPTIGEPIEVFVKNSYELVLKWEDFEINFYRLTFLSKNTTNICDEAFKAFSLFRQNLIHNGTKYMYFDCKEQTWHLRDEYK